MRLEMQRCKREVNGDNVAVKAVDLVLTTCHDMGDDWPNGGGEIPDAVDVRSGSSLSAPAMMDIRASRFPSYPESDFDGLLRRSPECSHPEHHITNHSSCEDVGIMTCIEERLLCTVGSHIGRLSEMTLTMSLLVGPYGVELAQQSSAAASHTSILLS